MATHPEGEYLASEGYIRDPQDIAGALGASEHFPVDLDPIDLVIPGLAMAKVEAGRPCPVEDKKDN